MKETASKYSLKEKDRVRKETLVRSLLPVVLVCLVFILLSGKEVVAKSKKKYKLSYTSKTMEKGELYNISLKGVPQAVKTKSIKWKSSNKKVVSIRSKKKNKAFLIAKKKGTQDDEFFIDLLFYNYLMHCFFAVEELQDTVLSLDDIESRIIDKYKCE